MWETYNLICNTNHEISNKHNSIVDKIYTKWIFIILLNVIGIGPHNLKLNN
jgi:hypothetical protein